jgi:hypothetical protein
MFRLVQLEPSSGWTSKGNLYSRYAYWKCISWNYLIDSCVRLYSRHFIPLYCNIETQRGCLTCKTHLSDLLYAYRPTSYISKELWNTSTALNTYVGVELLSMRGKCTLRIEFRLTACSYAGGRSVGCDVSHYTSCRASNQKCEYRYQHEWGIANDMARRRAGVCLKGVRRTTEDSSLHVRCFGTWT